MLCQYASTNPLCCSCCFDDDDFFDADGSRIGIATLNWGEGWRKNGGLLGGFRPPCAVRRLCIHQLRRVGPHEAARHLRDPSRSGRRPIQGELTVALGPREAEHSCMAHALLCMGQDRGLFWNRPLVLLKPTDAHHEASDPPFSFRITASRHAVLPGDCSLATGTGTSLRALAAYGGKAVNQINVGR